MNTLELSDWMYGVETANLLEEGNNFVNEVVFAIDIEAEGLYFFDCEEDATEAEEELKEAGKTYNLYCDADAQQLAEKEVEAYIELKAPTYRILAKTNEYLAQRKSLFQRGRTTRVLWEGNNLDEAKEKIKSFYWEDKEGSEDFDDVLYEEDGVYFYIQWHIGNGQYENV